MGKRSKFCLQNADYTWGPNIVYVVSASNLIMACVQNIEYAVYVSYHIESYVVYKILYMLYILFTSTPVVYCTHRMVRTK